MFLSNLDHFQKSMAQLYITHHLFVYALFLLYHVGIFLNPIGKMLFINIHREQEMYFTMDKIFFLILLL